MNGKKVSPVLCNCSANMTQKMISKITGKEVTSWVVTSILRGDKSCVYEIKL
jgi:predicted ArsR family transcriptional regulator